MSKKHWFKWVIEIEVDRSWVSDGFDINKENIHDKISRMLPYALGNEFRGKVLKHPTRKEIENI